VGGGGGGGGAETRGNHGELPIRELAVQALALNVVLPILVIFRVI